MVKLVGKEINAILGAKTNLILTYDQPIALMKVFFLYYLIVYSNTILVPLHCRSSQGDVLTTFMLKCFFNGPNFFKPNA